MITALTRSIMAMTAALSLGLAAAGSARAASLEFAGATYSSGDIRFAASQPVAFSTTAPAWAEFYAGEMWQKTISLAAGDAAVLVAYGGYGADEPGAKNWAQALGEAGGFKYVVAVKGPLAVDYSDHKKKEANGLLVKMLKGLNAAKIVIAAHSSGTYVAHELLAMLAPGGDGYPLLDKTVYYNLDGATCVPCRKLALASSAFKYTCVGAAQGALKSPNYYSVEACGKDHFLPLEFSAGCTGAWCMHACLINTRAAAIDPVRPSVPRYYADPLISVAAGFLGR
ncbi:MAG TPA: hypothetical protein PKI19_04215 [Elusimicrobiales bacterium]|nr:hypothetical protein [Elusimicrobiales bacterium]